MDLFDLALETKDYEWCKQLYEFHKHEPPKVENKPTTKLTVHIKIQQFVPFALLNHAEQYVNEDLKSLKLNGLIMDCSDYDEKNPWVVAILDIK